MATLTAVDCTEAQPGRWQASQWVRCRGHEWLVYGNGPTAARARRRLRWRRVLLWIMPPARWRG